MLALLVFLGGSNALNEFGDQVSELLLAARGKPMPERHRHWGNTALVVGRLTLPVPHGFPPLPA
jgi:hypothetical protein